MEMQELEIIIRRDGSLNVSVKGVSGEKCLAVTGGLERAVGKITGREYTSEYYMQDSLQESYQRDSRKSGN